MSGDVWAGCAIVGVGETEDSVVVHTSAQELESSLDAALGSRRQRFRHLQEVEEKEGRQSLPRAEESVGFTVPASIGTLPGPKKPSGAPERCRPRIDT